MPSIGKLDTRIVLDTPGRAHLGPLDAVTGKVIVTYSPSGKTQSNELFGPLRLQVLFQGRAKTKIYKRRGAGAGAGPATRQTQIFRGRVPLFATFWPVYDGTVKIAAGQSQDFPFTIYFPERAIPLQEQWDPHPYFQSTGMLPPSFTMNYQGFAHRFEAFTEYTVGAQIDMPGLDIKIPETPLCHATYSEPRIPTSQIVRNNIDFKQTFRIQNAELLLPENRPQGFKQKTKAIFSSSHFPAWCTDMHISVPQHLYLDEAITFTITLRPQPSPSVQITPEIHLDHFELILSGLTLVRAERTFFSEPQSEGNQNYASFTGRAERPFAKAEEYVKECRTSPLTKIPHTFSCTNIARSYSLNVKVVLGGAGERCTVERGFPVFVHPPVDGGGGGGVAGPSRGGGGEDVLPAYTAPPEYAAAAGSSRPQELVDDGGYDGDKVADGMKGLSVK